jgi:hypothetical protein
MEDDMAGKMHIELTGAINLSHDLEIRKCAVYYPLERAYFVEAHADDLFDKGVLIFPGYKGPGTYSPEKKLTYKEIRNNIHKEFQRNFIDLKFHDGSMLLEAPNPQVSFVIGKEGKSGSANFKDYKTPEWGSVSGIITWHCSEVSSVAF